MCPLTEMTRPAGFMKPEVFQKVISKIQPYAEMVYLIGWGEPLFNPDLPEYLRELKERQIPSGTSTNCTILTEEISESLLNNDLYLMILSLDAISAETYKAIRVKSDFDVVIQNIKNFLALKKKLKKKTFVQIQMIAMEQNKHEVNQFAEFIKKIDIHNQIDDIRIKPLLDCFVNDHAPPDEKVEHPCFLLWRNMWVNHDGMASVCCVDFNGSVLIGDFNQQSLDEIWNSSVMRAFREKHLMGNRNDISLCAKCDLDKTYPPLITAAATVFFNAAKSKKYISYYEKLLRKP
jgi:MoaA/NifB/PqqE/SkfB family radical SAM enzyme